MFEAKYNSRLFIDFKNIEVINISRNLDANY